MVQDIWYAASVISRTENVDDSVRFLMINQSKHWQWYNDGWLRITSSTIEDVHRSMHWATCTVVVGLCKYF